MPGIIWSLIWMKYSKHRPQTDKFYFSVYAITSSVICYAAILPLVGFEQVIEIFQKESGIDRDKVLIIFKASAAAVPIGFLLAILSHVKPVIRLMKYCGISSQDGELDLWVSSLCDHLSEKKSTAFVMIYENKNGMIYRGCISRISDEKLIRR